MLYFAYYHRYDRWIQSEEWTFVYCVLLGFGHALTFLTTRWSVGIRTFLENTKAESLDTARGVRVIPKKDKGKGAIVDLDRKVEEKGVSYSFIYQRDTYVLDGESRAIFTETRWGDGANHPPYRRPLADKTLTFTQLPYPCDASPDLSTFQSTPGLLTRPTSSKSPKLPLDRSVDHLTKEFGPNLCEIPIPKFTELCAEHAVAPFFVFQLFCVALWCLDEYWRFSLFTGFMLVAFECTTVFQVSRRSVTARGGVVADSNIRLVGSVRSV